MLLSWQMQSKDFDEQPSRYAKARLDNVSDQHFRSSPCPRQYGNLARARVNTYYTVTRFPQNVLWHLRYVHRHQLFVMGNGNSVMRSVILVADWSLPQNLKGRFEQQKPIVPKLRNSIGILSHRKWQPLMTPACPKTSRNCKKRSVKFELHRFDFIFKVASVLYNPKVLRISFKRIEQYIQLFSLLCFPL